MSKVTVDGEKARFDKTDGGHELRITPAQPLAAGSKHTVVVAYDDHPARYSYAGERNWLASKTEVVAMNEPHMAPWWFPANDHPLDKAIVDVKIRVPNGREVVSNGKLRGRKVGKRSTQWHWRADEPMVPYLAFFAAGDFAIEKGKHRGLPWLVAVSEDLGERDQAASMRLMKKTPAVVAGLEKDLGDYPFSVVGGITTGLNPGFALENQTRPTYPAVGGSATSLIVHELAHQWFGDDIAVEQLVRHLAQRGLRHLHGVALGRGRTVAAPPTPSSATTTPTSTRAPPSGRSRSTTRALPRCSTARSTVAARWRCRPCATGSGTRPSGGWCAPGSTSSAGATDPPRSSRRWPPG